eukprot:100185_1
MSDKKNQITKISPPNTQIQHSISSNTQFVAVRGQTYNVQDIRYYPLVTKLQQAVKHCELLLLQQTALESTNQNLMDTNMELCMSLNDAKENEDDKNAEIERQSELVQVLRTKAERITLKCMQSRAMIQVKDSLWREEEEKRKSLTKQLQDEKAKKKISEYHTSELQSLGAI